VGVLSDKFPEHGKILVPVDGSENSNRALTFATKFAEKYSASITVAHVVYLTVELITNTPDLAVTITKRFEEKGKKLLEDSLTQIQQAGIVGETVLLRGHIGPEIVSYTSRERFDMVVMGSRGLDALSRTIRGSISDYVIDHAKCPVFIIK
jgi:nucleotide-binding universal stress UspA family protein